MVALCRHGVWQLCARRCPPGRNASVKSEPAIKKKMKTRVLKKRCCKSQHPVDEVPSGTQGGIDSLCWGSWVPGALLLW